MKMHSYIVSSSSIMSICICPPDYHASTYTLYPLPPATPGAASSATDGHADFASGPAPPPQSSVPSLSVSLPTTLAPTTLAPSGPAFPPLLGSRPVSQPTGPSADIGTSVSWVYQPPSLLPQQIHGPVSATTVAPPPQTSTAHHTIFPTLP